MLLVRGTFSPFKNKAVRTFLAVQPLRFPVSVAGDDSSIPSLGTKIPCATQCGEKELVMNNNSIILAMLYHFLALHILLNV